MEIYKFNQLFIKTGDSSHNCWIHCLFSPVYISS
jgi:hypothetical protein